jgi:hypothetical protein
MILIGNTQLADLFMTGFFPESAVLFLCFYFAFLRGIYITATQQTTFA